MVTQTSMAHGILNNTDGIHLMIETFGYQLGGLITFVVGILFGILLKNGVNICQGINDHLEHQ